MSKLEIQQCVLGQVFTNCYFLKNKKTGVIIVGGAPTDNEEYKLIGRQFECMAAYLSWDMRFMKSYYANARDEMEKNADAMEELETLGRNL